MNNSIPSLSWLRLRFRLRALESGRLPRFKGSMLRGAFGHALRQTVCVMPRGQQCVSCSLRGECLNTRLFETYIDGEPPPFMRGLTDAPKPFILHSSNADTEFHTDNHIEFTLTLLGNACTYYPYCVFTVYNMARRGLGVRRLRFALQQVEQLTADSTVPIYDGDTHQLMSTVSPQSELPPVTVNSHLTCTFQTPTRIKVRGEYARSVNFRTLTFKMLNRLCELAHFYTPDQPVNWDFKEWLNRADEVQMTDASLSWQDITRYSNRQGTKMKLGGFVGSVQLHGNLEPFLPLLQLSEVVHVGKGTTFGLGKMGIKDI